MSSPFKNSEIAEKGVLGSENTQLSSYSKKPLRAENHSEREDNHIKELRDFDR